MEIKVTNEENATIVEVIGRIDALSAPAFENDTTGLLESCPGALIVDFSKLQYISSAGLRSILKLVKESKARKLNFMLCSLSKSVFDVFKLSGFASFLSIENSREEAIAKLAK